MNEREESIDKFGFVGMKMEYTTIDKISENLDGKRKPITSSDRTEGNIPYYGASGIVDYVEDYIFNESLLLVSEDGVNLLARSTPIAFSIEGKTWVNNHAHVLRFSNTVQQKYVELYLNHISLEAYITGSAQPKLNQKKLNEIPIPVVPAQEMAAVVTTIEKIQNIIRKRNEELVVLDNLTKARFIEMFGDPISNPFGWKKQRFDTLCENLDARRKPITASEREEGIYPYYGASGIVDHVAGYIFDEDILLVSEDGANLLMRSTPIAFSVCGKVWVNNHAHVVRFEKMSMQKYIEVYFSMIDITEQITGSAQPKLNQAKLNAMMFCVPDESKLEEFLVFIKQVDKSKVAVQKALDEAQLLFDSLMQKYFG